MEGRLCKACILFDLGENNVNRRIFVKRAFRDFNKPEMIREHAQTQYHHQVILRARELVKTYEDPATHVNHDVSKQKRCDRNIHILKLIIKDVNICLMQGLPLRGYRDNLNNLFSSDANLLSVVKNLADIYLIL